MNVTAVKDNKSLESQNTNGKKLNTTIDGKDTKDFSKYLKNDKKASVDVSSKNGEETNINIEDNKDFGKKLNTNVKPDTQPSKFGEGILNGKNTNLATASSNDKQEVKHDNTKIMGKDKKELALDSGANTLLLRGNKNIIGGGVEPINVKNSELKDGSKIALNNSSKKLVQRAKKGPFSNVDPKLLKKKGSLALNKNDYNVVSSQYVSKVNPDAITPQTKAEKDLILYNQSLKEKDSKKETTHTVIAAGGQAKEDKKIDQNIIITPKDIKKEKIKNLKKEIVYYEGIKSELDKGVPTTSSLVSKYYKEPILDVKKLDIETADINHLNSGVTNFLQSNDLRSVNNILVTEVKRTIKHKIIENMKYAGENVRGLKYPKTLNGLLALAKSRHIVIKNITINKLMNTSGKYAIDKIMRENLNGQVKMAQRNYYILKQKYSLPKLNNAKVELATLLGNSNNSYRYNLDGKESPFAPKKSNVEFKTAFSEGSFMIKQALSKHSTDGNNMAQVEAHKGDKTFFAEGDKRKNLDVLPSQSMGSINFKSNEAKLMLKNFSRGLRSEIINYKSPFSRVNMNLEPANLGSVKLTIVNQGNKLHINVSSNPVALNLMALHQNELKSELSSMGLTNLNMNFNNSESESRGKQNQNKKQNQDKDSGSEEEITSLDIFTNNKVAQG